MLIKLETSVNESVRLMTSLRHYNLECKHRRNLRKNSVALTIKVDNGKDFRSACIAIQQEINAFR